MNRRQFLSRSVCAAATSQVFVAGSARGADKRWRACVIGDTHQGGYGHSLHLVWRLRDDVDVVGLADPDAAGREKHGAEAGAQRLYADYREMLEQERPDLVAIGPRWTTRHREYLLACAEFGAHGILEKPLTPDLAEADEAIAAMDAKKLKWSIAFNLRAAPAMEHARRLIVEEGLIGEILELRGRGKEDRRAGGEDLIVLGSHILDLMRYFMGMPLWCAANIAEGTRPATPKDVREATEPLGPIVGDRIHATFGFACGAPGYFASMKHEEPFPGRWGLDIYGAKGVVAIRMNGAPKASYLLEPSWAPAGKDSPWSPLPNAPEVPVREPSQVSHYAPIIDDLLAAIEEDREPNTSLRHGRDALEMIQAVFEAHLQGGRIALPLQDRTHPLKRWKDGGPANG